MYFFLSDKIVVDPSGVKANLNFEISLVLTHPSEMLQKFSYFWNTKIYVYSGFFSFLATFPPLMNTLVYEDIDKVQSCIL